MGQGWGEERKCVCVCVYTCICTHTHPYLVHTGRDQRCHLSVHNVLGVRQPGEIVRSESIDFPATDPGRQPE